MPSALIVSPHIHIPERELEISFARSSGPGGQNVNKVNSKAVLRWNVTHSPSLPEAVRERFLARFASRVTAMGDVVLTSDRFRDQGRNTEDCIEKLRELLMAVAHPPKQRKRTKPTRASRERRLRAKGHHSQKKKSRGKFDHD